MPFLYIVVGWGGRGVGGGGVSKSEFLWFSNGHILLLLHFLAVVLIVIIVGVEFIRIYSNIFIVKYIRIRIRFLFLSRIYSYSYSVLIFEPNIFVFVFGFNFWTEYIRIRIRFLFLNRIYSYSYLVVKILFAHLCLGANLSLLWAHYHLNLAFVHFIKSTRKSLLFIFGFLCWSYAWSYAIFPIPDTKKYSIVLC